jgi:hypothetical protein
MINEKGGYVTVLKNKLDELRRQHQRLSNKYRGVKNQNRLLREQLALAKKQVS